jgi:hypothetical protein
MGANASEVRAGKAFVELATRDISLKKGLERASAQLRSMGAVAKAAGANLVGMGVTSLRTMFDLAKSFSDTGSELYDMSTRTGVAVEALSALGYAADQSGSDLGTVEFGLRRAQNAIEDAAGGSKEAVETFNKLGLSVASLKKLTPDAQFERIATKIAAMKDPSQRTAAALDVFGKSGTQLLPMLMELAAQTERAKRLGVVVTGEDAALADQFGDALGDVWKQLKMVAFHAGAAVAKALTPYAETVTTLISKGLEWLGNNRDLVVSIGAIAGVVTAAGVGLVGLGLTFSVIGTALGGLASAGAIAGTVISALASPLGITAALAAGLGTYLVYATDVGQQALDYLVGKFNELKDEAMPALNAIRDAMASGDWGTAAKVMWTLIKFEWAQGIAALERMWVNFKFRSLKVFADMTAFVVTTHEEAVHAVAQKVAGAQAGGESFLSKVSTALKLARVSLGNLGEHFMVAIGQSTKRPEDIDAASFKRIFEVKAEQGSEGERIEREHQERVEAGQRMHEEAIARINDKHEDDIAQLNKDQAAALAENADDVARAMREFRQSVSELRSLQNDPNEVFFRDADRKRGAPRYPDINEITAKIKAKMDVAGTFSAAVVGRLGPQNTMEKIAANPTRIADNTPPSAQPPSGLVWR